MLFTKFLVSPATERKRPRVNVAGAQIGAASRTRRNPETGKCRKHGQMRVLRAESGVNERAGEMHGKGLAPQVKQRVFCSRETRANHFILNGLFKTVRGGRCSHLRFRTLRVGAQSSPETQMTLGFQRYPREHMFFAPDHPQVSGFWQANGFG